MLAGCGGSEQSTAEAPAIPGAVAEDLAAKSDEIADLIDAGDLCSAAHKADDLNAATITAINRGQIPARLQEELQSTVNELVNEVNCPAPSPPPSTTQPPAEDPCADLEQQKQKLEEQLQDAEGEEKDRLEKKLKQVENELKKCKKENGGGEGD